MRVALPLLLGVLQTQPSNGQQPTLEQMREVAQQMPLDAGAQSNYGAALKASGDLHGAIERFQASIALDPQYARGYNNLGNAYQALGDYEHAMSLHTMAIRLLPTLASAYSNLGNALRVGGKPEAAVPVLMLAVQVNPLFTAAYTNLGAATQAAGEPALAVRWHEVSTRLAPNDPTTRSNLGAALEATGRLAEAARSFERGLTLAPRSTTLHINLGNVLRGMGRLDESIFVYGEALRIEPHGADAPLAYNNLAAALQASGNAWAAQNAYAAAITLKPADPLAQRNLDKLPISDAYRAAAAYESRVLASRAARVTLAMHGAALGAGYGGRGAGSVAAPGEPLSAMLHRVVRYLRRLETEQVAPNVAAHLWSSRAEDMSTTITSQKPGGAQGGAEAPFSLANFAWGGVWAHTFAAALAHPAARAALFAARDAFSSRPGGLGRLGGLGGSIVVLGSNLGFESYFLSLTYGARVVGVEILCSLNELAEALRRAQRIPADLNVFQCDDALAFELPADTNLVYADDTSWDAPAVEQLSAKLARELRPGAIVVHNTEAGFGASPSYRGLDVASVGTSWNDEHRVFVHEVV